MSSGYLLFPPGYHPLISGAVVPSGKLYFYRTATTTAQDTYTDADLSVANSNPVVLNATGGLDTHIYLDPTTGFRYRCRIYSSADVLLDTFDDLLGFGADTATFASGSFTGTLTGYASGPTGTISYAVVANSAGTGKIAHLWADSAITGTSNATSLTMTGAPAAVRPVTAARVGATFAVDNNTLVAANFSIATGGTITFGMGAGFSGTGFTNSGTKGLGAGWSISYSLV